MFPALFPVGLSSSALLHVLLCCARSSGFFSLCLFDGCLFVLSGKHAGRRQQPVFWVPGSGPLLEPRTARAPVPPEAPGVLRSDVSGKELPHVQRKKYIDPDPVY